MVYLAKELDKQNIKIQLWLVVQLLRVRTQLWKSLQNTDKQFHVNDALSGNGCRYLLPGKKYTQPQFGKNMTLN
jgi:hypothetical protein